MGGRTASQRRALVGQLANLYQKGTLVGARVIRRVPLTLALEKVARRKWRTVTFENGDLAGFQPYTEPEASKRAAVKVGVLGGSPAAITPKESLMSAGVFGPSREAGDAIECAIEKVRIWPELQGIEPGLKPLIVEGTQI